MPDMSLNTNNAAIAMKVKDLGDGTFAQVMAGDPSSPMPVVIGTSASGGLSQSKVMSAATTNATLVRAGATKLCGYEFSNSNAAFRYVKLYNKATAPTVGTDTPVRTIGVPPGGRVQMTQSLGIGFPLGLAYAITSGSADNDTAATVAGDVIGALDYV